MARIAGVNIPLNKRVEVGLTYVHGIGPSTASKIVADAYAWRAPAAVAAPAPRTINGITPAAACGAGSSR